MSDDTLPTDGLSAEAAQVRPIADDWEVAVAEQRSGVAAPRARAAAGAARPLGADTAAVLRELSIPC